MHGLTNGLFLMLAAAFGCSLNLATQAYYIPDTNRQIRRNRSGFPHFQRSRVVVGSDLILR
jgi:hypothetical protein